MTTDDPYDGADQPGPQDFPPPNSFPDPNAPQAPLPPSQQPQQPQQQPPTQAPYPDPGQPNPSYAPPQQQPNPGYAPPQQQPGPGNEAPPHFTQPHKQPPGQPPGQGPYPQYPQAAPLPGGVYGGNPQAGYQHYPAPGGQQYPPAYAAPRKKSKKWTLWLLAVPVLGLLGIGGCAALLLRAVSGPIDATNEFVARLDDGEYVDAYNSLCQATKSQIDVGAWVAGVETGLGGGITDYNFSEASISSGSGQSTAVVSGTIEVDGLSRSITYGLVEEGSEWRVCEADQN